MRRRAVLARGMAAAVVLVSVLGGTAAAAGLSQTHTGTAVAAGSSQTHTGKALVEGTFKLHGVITTAVNVRGEHRGQHIVRIWKLRGRRCTADGCPRLRLTRERSAGIDNSLTLVRHGGGKYSGSGVFYTPLSCEGRIYPKGSRVPYTVTLTVTGTTEVGGLWFADRVKATYLNRHRTDLTPCPMVPPHDAARYSGKLTSARPQAPTAAFTDMVDSAAQEAVFSDTSRRGSGGPIVSVWWNFGDPDSGKANISTTQNPTHIFSAPGSYTVTLTVTDKLGMVTAVSHEVVIPPTPTPMSGSSRRS